MDRVRAIAVDGHGRMLFGVTRTGQYRLLGGKLKEGENPEAGLRREMLEEASIKEASLTYLFCLHDNYVFLAQIEINVPLSPLGDPDREFDRLELIRLNPQDPPPLDDYSEAILYHYLLWQKRHAEAGTIQVFDDQNRLIMELGDDVIWQTMPRLAQEKAKGRKLFFKQKLDDGRTIDFSADSLAPYFYDFKRLRVLGLDTGLCVRSGQKLTGVTACFGSDLKLHFGDHVVTLAWPQLAADYHLMDAEDLFITAHAPDAEAKRLAAELYREYFPEDESTVPLVVIVSDSDFMAATRHDPNTGNTYIAVNENWLSSPHLRQILAHEVIHYFMARNHPNGLTDKHGDDFCKLAKRINEREGDRFVMPIANETRWAHTSNI